MALLLLMFKKLLYCNRYIDKKPIIR